MVTKPLSARIQASGARVEFRISAREVTTAGRIILMTLVCLAVTTGGAGQCAKDNQTDKNAGVLLNDLSIVGPTNLTSDELAGIAGEMTGSCFDEDSDELGERVRMLFQERGYFTVKVKSVHLKAGDPLRIPKPVSMEAEVEEGQRYKLGEVKFVNNHAFTAEHLRQEFPIKSGDWFSRGKVASGLDQLRRSYGSTGFLDFTSVPETELGSNAVVNLTIDIDEGPQYHLQKVEFAAEKQLAARARAQWKLDQGAPYDWGYIDHYIETNRDLLPSGFGRQNVHIGKNCPEALIEVRLVLDPEEDAAESKPKNVACEKKTDEAGEKAK